MAERPVELTTAVDHVEQTKKLLVENPTSHSLYIGLITRRILSNQIIVFGGPLGVSADFVRRVYIEIHNIHANAGCDSPTNKCEPLL